MDALFETLLVATDGSRAAQKAVAFAVDFAEEAVAVGADHIIIGSTGQTQPATCVLGSVAQNVVHYAHCPVTVVR